MGQLITAHAPEDTRVALLRNLAPTRGLPERALSDLAGRARIRDFPRSAVIVSQNEPGSSLYLLETGRARVALTAENGREVTLGLLRRGDLFGELALLDGEARMANVVAVSAVRAVAIEGRELRAHIEAFPATAFRLLAEMSRRIRRADEMIADLALHTVDTRLARMLIGLAREDGTVGPEGLTIHARPTQQEIASMVGTCRETVSRAIAAWQRRGWVTPRGRSLILSPEFVEQASARRRAA